MGNVFIIVVTYNRKECLQKLLLSLINQSYKPKYILIFDNDSSDGTDLELINKGFLNSNYKITSINEKKVNDISILYYKNNINTGGSGGFAKAFKLSFGFEYDYLWVMDDDVKPNNNCLEILLSNIDDTHEVVIPNRTCKLYDDYPIIGWDLKSKFKLLDNRKIEDKKCNSNVDVVDITFEGPLFTHNIVTKVGIPDEKYFILFDDSDYAMRCLKYTKIKFVFNAILNRQLPTNSKNIKFNWKQYYAYRNTVYFYNKYGLNHYTRKTIIYINWIVLIIKFLLKGRFYNIKIVSKAFRDGLKKIRGKSIDPGTL